MENDCYNCSKNQSRPPQKPPYPFPSCGAAIPTVFYLDQTMSPPPPAMSMLRTRQQTQGFGMHPPRFGPRTFCSQNLRLRKYVNPLTPEEFFPPTERPNNIDIEVDSTPTTTDTPPLRGILIKEGPRERTPPKRVSFREYCEVKCVSSDSILFHAQNPQHQPPMDISPKEKSNPVGGKLEEKEKSKKKVAGFKKAPVFYIEDEDEEPVPCRFYVVEEENDPSTELAGEFVNVEPVTNLNLFLRETNKDEEDDDEEEEES